jgi:hypothetical protein
MTLTGMLSCSDMRYSHMFGMRYFLVVSVFFASITGGACQFGAGIKYQLYNSDYLMQAFDLSPESTLNRNLAGVSAYYWFRLKNVRIEFLPEVGYWQSVAHSEDAISSRMRAFPLLINSDIYLFDLLNDCDCPTFSKQGTFFQRGFFLELSGGIEFQTLELQDASGESVFDVTESTFRGGFGFGLDIGISDLITVTPLVFMHWHETPSSKGVEDALGVAHSQISAHGGDWYRGFTLRAIFRPDYTRNRY